MSSWNFQASTVTLSGPITLTGPVDTELPAAASLGDAELNTNAVPSVGSRLMGFNGTTWDRLRSDITNGLDVDVTRVSGTVTVAGTVTANAGTNLNTSLLALESGGNLAAAAVSLAIHDDWDESDRAKVNPIVGQAGVQGASGVVTALTQRVVLATDVPLPTGSNTIGAVTISGTVTPTLIRSATVTLTRTATSTTSAQVLAANASRNKAIFVNESTTSGGFLKFGTTASATSYSIRMEAKEQYIEEGDGLCTTLAHFILDSGTSNMQVSEFTT